MGDTSNQEQKVIAFIVKWLNDYADDAGIAGWVVGVSGGIDSAVTSALCALTGKAVHLVEMPIHQHPDQVGRAQRHMSWLQKLHGNVSVTRVELTPVYDAFVDALPHQNDPSNGLALANSRARLRMTALYAIAAQHRSLVVGTGNKVEDFGVGFYTKYGDGGVDISPIADLMKTEVFALGRELGISDEILQAAPTDGLWGDDRTDEDQLGASYPELEWAMRASETLISDKDQAQWSERQKEVMDVFLRWNAANQHKMNPIPVCLIPSSLKN